MDHSNDLFHTLPFAIASIKLSAEGSEKHAVFTKVNSSFQKIINLSEAQVLGMPVENVFHGNSHDKNYWLSYFASVLRSGKTQETTQRIDSLHKEFNIMLIPQDRETLTILLRESSYSSNHHKDTSDNHLAWDLEAVFNNTHDAISLVEYKDGTFRYIRNNEVHRKLTGFDSIAGVTPIDLVGEEIGSKLIHYYEECLRTGKPVIYEQTYRFAPGKRIFHTKVTPVYGKEGIRYLLCSSQDISELKAMESDHQALARRLNAAFDEHSAIMLIFDVATGKILNANPAACQFYGYSHEEFLTLNIRDINMLPSEQFEQNCQDALHNKHTFSVVPHRLKNGEIRLIDVYASPINDNGTTALFSIMFDATDREQYRNELFLEKEILRTTLQSIGDGVVTTDNNGIITSLNTMAQHITGWDANYAVGKSFQELFVLKNEDTGEPVENPIEKVLTTGRIVGLANHTVLINTFGKAIPIADSAAPIKSEDGTTFGVVMVFRDVSNEKAHNDRIRFLSYHDELTGLYNRRYIEEMLPKLDKKENLPLSVVIGDVNGLKITNDVFGHQSGDILLKQVAKLISHNCKNTDYIARWGGDEFMILMPSTSLAGAEEFITRIKNDPAALDYSGLRLGLSLSLGCSVKQYAFQSIQNTIREAEESMYHQKLLDGKSYRNTIISTLLATLYEKSMETETHSKRMEAHCHSIGRKLQLSSKEMGDLSLLAILHDIGKVAINEEILKKPGPLTEAEWFEMKRHPEIGYRIAQATPELASVSEHILCHHERWDGKGYPTGLRETQIPLVCRVLAVTDTYDAMTNDRSYRKARSHQEAIQEIKRNSGTQFDPMVVEAFLETLKEMEK